MFVDLDAAVTYRSFLVNDPDLRANILGGGGIGSGIGGCVIDRIDMSELDVAQFREKRSLQDGMDVGDVYLGGRVVKISGTIYGRTHAALADFYQQLRAIMSPTLAFREELSDKGYRPLAFSKPTLRTTEYDESVILLRIVVMPQKFDCDINRRQAGGAAGKGLALPWTATMYARNPVIQGVDPIRVDFDVTDDSEEQPCTGVAATNIITSAAHGLSNGDNIYFTRLVGGTGLTIGTRYFVRNVTTNTFKVATALGGAAVDFTTDITSAIHVEVDAELTRLTPGSIRVAGNEASDATMDDLAAYTAGSVTRKSGTDRWKTAAAISAATFSPGVDVVYITAGAPVYDGAAAAAAATQEGGPLLYVTSSIPASVATELTRLAPLRIEVVGGVVSAAVFAALGAYTAGAVTRRAGTNRYATAAAVSAAVFSSGVDVVYIVEGWTETQDHAIAAAAAAKVQGPVLYVAETSIPSATATELDRLNPLDIIIVGGRVSTAVATALAAYTVGSVTRLAGVSAYSTAAIVSAATYAAARPVCWVVGVNSLPDQVAAAAAAGLVQGSLLLVATGSSAYIAPVTVTGELTNRGDYHVPLNMYLRVSGHGTITVSAGDSTFVLTVEDSTGDRIYRVKGEDKVLTVEEEGIEALRQDLISFEGNTTWPLIPGGTSPWSVTLAGVTIVGV